MGPYRNFITRSGLGGQGGGAIEIVTRHLILDGHLSADGEDGPPPSTAGGGSGGSIWIDCEELDGYGTISANGGAGSPSKGGGGSGGRIAIYQTFMLNFNGTLSAKGGNSAVEPGASGTVFLETRNNSKVEYRVLKINNFGLAYPWAVDKSQGRLRNLMRGIYTDTKYVGAVTWLHEADKYTLDEFHLHGNSHVALYGNGSRGNVTLYTHTLRGDRSGVFHVGRFQSVVFDFVDLYFPINTLVYFNATLEVPRRLSLREVYMEINGTLADSDDYTIDRDGKLFLWSGGQSLGEKKGHFRFINMSIKSLGLLHTTKIQGHGPVSLHTTRFVVNAGGLASVDDFFLYSVNATIDVAGEKYVPCLLSRSFSIFVRKPVIRNIDPVRHSIYITFLEIFIQSMPSLEAETSISNALQTQNCQKY